MKLEGTSRRTLAGCLPAALLALVPTCLPAQELTITHVQPEHSQLTEGERLKLRFEVSRPANVTLQLYDGRDLLIREISSESLLEPGEHTLEWDLRDQAGEPVPPEAYTYVLDARAADGQAVRYDLADQTGGEPVAPREVKWDPHTGRLSYLLDRPARVNVRLGLQEGGPLLHTLIDWVVRPAGLQQEVWNGQDAAGVLDLTHHPKLAVAVQAFSLPENSIIVGPPQTQVQLISTLAPRQERPKTQTRPKRMYAHGQQRLEERGDFQVRLTLPAQLPRTEAGLPIISAPTPVRLEVDPKDRDRALARRFEPVFFIDGHFAFENEVGFVPMTWNFDPTTLNEGEHFLTVNLRGYEGNFGMTTVKVWVARDATSDATASRGQP